jgi:hypothetical protein
MHKQKQTIGIALTMIIFCCYVSACSEKVGKTGTVKAASATSASGTGGQGGSSGDTTAKSVSSGSQLPKAAASNRPPKTVKPKN